MNGTVVSHRVHDHHEILDLLTRIDLQMRSGIRSSATVAEMQSVTDAYILSASLFQKIGEPRNHLHDFVEGTHLEDVFELLVHVAQREVALVDLVHELALRRQPYIKAFRKVQCT